MKIHYTGRHEELSPAQCKKIEAKLAKVSRLIERDGEREAHVIVTNEKLLHCVEITLNAFDHAMVGEGSDSSFDTALSMAADRLAKQVVKLRTKWRTTTRHKGTVKSGSAPEEKVDVAPVNSKDKPRKPKIFRVKGVNGRKPMSVQEAVLEMERHRDYLVYRDATNDRVSVMFRRPDGNFDLIES